MNSGTLLQAALSAFSAGSACSICGASASSAFLSSFIMTHKKITFPVFSFLAGKTAMTVFLCMLSAFCGKSILDADGLIGKVDLYLAAQLFVLVISLILIGQWIYRKLHDKGNCRGQKSCRRHGQKEREPLFKAAALFASGISCGATPCGPLFLVLGQSAACTLAGAAASGIVFSITGFLSPVLIWLVISRLLAGKMYREIARWIKWFQLGCYLILACVILYTIVLYRF